MERYCYLRNVQDLLAEGKTPYERRFGEPSKELMIPFGAMVECHPISVRDQSRLQQFGKKVLPGIFLGCELVAAGIWNGDILTADLHQKFGLEESTRKKYGYHKKEINSNSRQQVVQQNVQ